MSVTISTTYWLKNGDTSRPYISTTKTNDQTGSVLSSSNPPTVPPDIEITEAEYNQYIQDIEVNMSVTISTTYWLKNGEVSRPFISTTKTNDQTGRVLSSSNPPTSPPDIEITEAEYNQYIQDIDDSIEAGRTASVTAFWANIEAQKATATPKLVAIGLTQAEIDAIFRF